MAQTTAKAYRDWNVDLLMLLHVIAEHEMNIEEVRMELCQNQEFSPVALFKFLKMDKADSDTVHHD